MSTGADSAREGPRILVLCIGNPDRGDDAAGRAVARALRASAADVEIIEEEGEATRILARLEGADAAYIVDACVSGAEPGDIRRFDVGASPLPRAAFGASTHGFGLAEALELARALGALPPRCVVYAIEGGTFDAGAPMSPAVAAAVDIVAGRLRRDMLGK
ncbi:hydrogenase maturation protease [Methylocystis sp. SC2]|uniref:hydrogenase maturation protease n=1 Tax=Methylocystis sp. (strain SC2) TaxID=187303 RepID=UPI00027AEC54|nr:hydrogenase maturation protease [Methylocystis sp. SC2]CCJ06295.1 Hydrogenase maturation protease [Methylocystis sp. SC2]